MIEKTDFSTFSSHFSRKKGIQISTQYIEMGNRIKIRRKELNIKQAVLAERLDISNNHMSAIENGREKPSFDVFLLLCEHLEVTPNYLVLGCTHAYNIPLDIYEKLLLCTQEDIKLISDIIELLIQRNK